MTNTAEVNKHNMLLWYRALKSGQYQQGQSYLARPEPDGTTLYCCLGVACEVAIADGLGLEKKRIGPAYLYGNDNNFTGDDLPEMVRDWLGLHSGQPQISLLPVTGEGLCDGNVCNCNPVTAIRANDFLNWTFDQIADAIYEYFGLAEVDPEAVRG